MRVRPFLCVVLCCGSVGMSLAAAPKPLPVQWGTFVSPPGRTAVAEMRQPMGEGGPGWLRLTSNDYRATAGANSGPLPKLAGRLKIEYKSGRVFGPGDGVTLDNLTIHVLPLNAGGTEVGGAGRTTYAVPAEHVIDLKTHTATLDYNYLGTDVAKVILGPRVNEGGGKGTGELWVGRVTWEPLPPKLTVLRFGPEHTIRVDDFEKVPTPVHAVLRNTGGEPASLAGLKLEAGYLKVMPVGRIPRSVPPMGEVRLRWNLTSPRHGTLIPVRLTMKGVTPRVLAEQPLAWGVANGLEPISHNNTRLNAQMAYMQEAPSLTRLASMLWMWGNDPSDPTVSHLSYLFPLSSFTLSGGETHYLQAGASEIERDAAAGEVRIRHEGHTAAGVPFTWSVRLSQPKDDGIMLAEYALKAGADLSLSRFVGPTVEAGRQGDTSWAHFPGLEYLAAGQASSENAGDPERLRRRFLPHPRKVTQPWMAVSSLGIGFGLAWDPRQPWTDKWDYQNDSVRAPLVGIFGAEHLSPPAGLQPYFASPDFLHGTQNSTMALSLPTVGEGLEENAIDLMAQTPLQLKKGQTLRLRARIFCRIAHNAADAAALGWELTPPDPLPLPDRLAAQTVRLSLRSYTDQLWVPEAKGWRMHLPLTFEQLSRPSPSPAVARAIWRAARRLPEGDALRRKAEEQAESVMYRAVAGDSPLGPDAFEAAAAMGFPTATLLPRLRKGLDGILASQEKDGSWRFRPDKAHEPLGKDGETAVGLIAGNAAALLRYAERSKDKEVEAAGLRAVRFMETLPRPEGSQVWEVPLHVPDILAAGNAIPAYLAAYRITKDRHWLEQAVRSAKSGLPFIYKWSPPYRQRMLYGTVPVFGTSWHALPWFGYLVQWNGLAYAAELPALAQLDSSLPWRQIAEGITACAIQLQRKDREPMYGLYPDVWSALTDAEPFPVPYINPSLILDCLNALGEESAPAEPESGA